MAIRDVVTMGFGSWQTDKRFIPTLGYTVSAAIGPPYEVVDGVGYVAGSRAGDGYSAWSSGGQGRPSQSGAGDGYSAFSAEGQGRPSQSVAGQG